MAKPDMYNIQFPVVGAYFSGTGTLLASDTSQRRLWTTDDAFIYEL